MMRNIYCKLTMFWVQLGTEDNIVCSLIYYTYISLHSIDDDAEKLISVMAGNYFCELECLMVQLGSDVTGDRIVCHLILYTCISCILYRLLVDIFTRLRRL